MGYDMYFADAPDGQELSAAWTGWVRDHPGQDYMHASIGQMEDVRDFVSSMLDGADIGTANEKLYLKFENHMGAHVTPAEIKKLLSKAQPVNEEVIGEGPLGEKEELYKEFLEFLRAGAEHGGIRIW